MTKNTFCVIPWVQMATKPIGSARVCCLMTNSKNSSQGVISDQNNIPYNLGRDDFDIIKNGQKAREIRLALLNDERPEDCNTCWIKEDMGAPSRRTVSNKMYKNEFNKEIALQHTDEKGYTDWQPSYWDLRFGNLCNLKCVMCHPASSNQWYEDYVLLNKTDNFTDAGSKVILKEVNGRYKDSGEYEWWNNADFWNRLEQKIPFLKQVYLVGGEPMLIEPHYDFLQKVIDSGRAHEVTLEYDTNLTSIHQRALDLWKNFKKVWLRISVDDYGDQFNYIRYPANWTMVSKNIERLHSEKNIKFDFTVTWQVLSSFTTPNLLRYLNKFEDASIAVRILSNPQYYDVSILSSDAKKELINIYKELEVELPSVQINHLINYLELKSEENEDQLKKFLTISSQLDNIRNTNWRETFVDLSKFI